MVQAGAVHGGIHITRPAGTEAPVPRQLPMAAPGFVNRQAELAHLDSLLPPETPRPGSATAPPGAAVAVSAIGGAPGMGKTALALHWAHRVRDRFPDGDLYVNLHGHGPGPRMDASAALDSLLRALGVPPERIPPDLDGRAALYRSRLDRRRVLILIDDAVAPEQVRPLLPASPTCTVLITSRSALSGLVAREGARRMRLDALTAEQSLALLRAHLGARIDAEPEAARALVDHCARLPLALRILAERLLDRPDTPLSHIAAELAAEDERLDALGLTGDELSDVRSVFAASYRALPDDAALVFRHLGAHPAGEFTTPVAAAVTKVPLRRARALVEQLAGASLLQRVSHDRYRMHDLLRVYAAERFHAEEPEGGERDVVARAADWYLAALRNAVGRTTPHYPPVDAAGEPPAAPPDFASVQEALAWFSAEHRNIGRVAQAAAHHRVYDRAWRLPVAAYPLLERQHRWSEWHTLTTTGLAAARAAGDRRGQARNLLGLGDVETLQGNRETALGHYAEVLQAGRAADDPWVEGFALRQLGALRWERDQDPAAPALLQEALAAFRRAGARRGAGMVLLSLAECERAQGRFDTAIEHCRAAAAVFTDIADAWSTAWAGRALASVLADAGRLDEAVTEYGSAIAILREVGSGGAEALARIGLGEAYAAMGRPEQARAHLGAALDFLRSVEDPRADEVEASLAHLDPPTAPD
ncbi:tetratricopeptide repeat protein [Streptomonospora sp. S1-112]|uniref:Tetratricopeptide repeat protein n=1 Tax=Streptomonospora mangrovi TaxID=2883123 RepID=A0A9X3NPL3_9ACTN|nr:tetratricopeptide repeat protein [Streptomonospora mangrovi]MDA0566013.1 tetratricopeptide repeat protein [Streptomonospora mangrovi]